MTHGGTGGWGQRGQVTAAPVDCYQPCHAPCPSLSLSSPAQFTAAFTKAGFLQQLDSLLSTVKNRLRTLKSPRLKILGAILVISVDNCSKDL